MGISPQPVRDIRRQEAAVRGGGAIGADHLMRHPVGLVLIYQTSEYPLGCVPLLARRIQISPQHPVDQRLEPPSRLARGAIPFFGSGYGWRNASAIVFRRVSPAFHHSE